MSDAQNDAPLIARQQVMRHVVGLLEGIARRTELQPTALPEARHRTHIGVDFDGDAIDTVRTSQTSDAHEMVLLVRIRAKADAEADEQIGPLLDELAMRVEIALRGRGPNHRGVHEIAGCRVDIDLTGTVPFDRTEELETDAGGLELSFDAAFKTQPGNPAQLV